MNADLVRNLFQRQSHNPSFHSVRCARGDEQDLLDFCVPVNLHFPPPALVQLIVDNLPEILRHYPDYADVHQQHIAELIGVPAETIVPANGSTEIITALCREAEGPILTSIPTFGRWTDIPVELNLPLYTIQRRPENAFRLNAIDVAKRARAVGARTVVVSNPNNPTGAGFTLEEIKILATELHDLQSVVVDESFIDFSNLESADAYAATTRHVVVVKSMGKSIGWHGVRLGYAVASPERARTLRNRLPYWNVNGLAAFILRWLPAFRNEYRASFVAAARDRAHMMSRLAELKDLTVYPSHANFLFVELPEDVSGRVLRDQLLLHHGLLIRETSNKTGSSERYLRLAVQGELAVEKLARALSAELRFLTRDRVGKTA